MTKKIAVEQRIFEDMMRNPLNFLMSLSQLAQMKPKTRTKTRSTRNNPHPDQGKTR